MGLSITYTKTETDFLIQQRITTAYLGIATTTTTPPATGAYWYRVDAVGTYMGVTVTEADFKDAEGNYFDVTLEVKDGVATKRKSLISISSDSRYLAAKDYIGKEFQNELPLPAAASLPTSQSIILNVPSQRTGVITKMKVVTAATGIVKFQVVKRLSNNYPSIVTGNKETFIGGEKFTVNATAVGIGTYDVIGAPQIEKGDYIAYIFESGDTPILRFGGTDSLPAYGRWNAGSTGYLNNEVLMTYTSAGVGIAYEVDYDELILRDDIKPIETKMEDLKISNEIISNNLFDKSKVVLNGYVKFSDGTIGSTTGYSYIRNVPCKPSTNYIKSNTQQVAFFD